MTTSIESQEIQMDKESLSTEEIEDLSYYDFMGYMDVPFFNIGGLSSIDRLAELCKIGKDQRVLVVGCGTGWNSCYIAREFECNVVGIDIAEHMITRAKERAEEMNLTDKVDFRIGDAYNLQFDDNSFDVVLTVFVSQFLDKTKAFKEFVRVLKPNGYLGINEMYKADEIPLNAIDKVTEGEKIFQDITDLPFTLNTPTEWKNAFQNATFVEIYVEEIQDPTQNVSVSKTIKEIGGYRKFLSILWKMLVLAAKSKKIRKKYGQISKGKRILLRDKTTSPYLGYLLAIGIKP